MTVLTRTVATPLEQVGDGRTLIALVMPYDREAIVNDGFGAYRESFDRGAFRKVMTGRPHHVRLHMEHPGDWIGRGDRWLDSDDGLTMAFRIDDTEAGRTAAFKISDGQLPGVSVCFLPGRTVTKVGPDGPVEHRKTVKSLHHVALVQQPAYEDAQITAVRHASADRLALWQSWLNDQRNK